MDQTARNLILMKCIIKFCWCLEKDIELLEKSIRTYKQDLVGAKTETSDNSDRWLWESTIEPSWVLTVRSWFKPHSWALKCIKESLFTSKIENCSTCFCFASWLIWILNCINQVRDFQFIFFNRQTETCGWYNSWYWESSSLSWEGWRDNAFSCLPVHWVYLFITCVITRENKAKVVGYS